jgi:probable phosphoglycerate mutase
MLGHAERMTATFLLIRHAAHVHLDRLLSGRMPGVGLSETGRKQAARLGERFGTERVDRVVASPLDRTRDTAAAVAGVRGIAVELLDGLIELDFGAWTGRAIADLDGEPAWTAWNETRSTARIPGGETMGEAQGRIVATLQALAVEASGQVVVVVSHADLIKAAVAHVLGLSLDKLGQFDISPASVTRVVWGDWGERLMSLNETER